MSHACLQPLLPMRITVAGAEVWRRMPGWTWGETLGGDTSETNSVTAAFALASEGN